LRITCYFIYLLGILFEVINLIEHQSLNQEELMKAHVIAELSIVPIGTMTTGLSQYVAACIEILRTKTELQYQITSMGTIIEGPLDSVLEVAGLMHEIPFTRGAFRVLTTIRIDDRRDKVSTMSGKVKSVLNSLTKPGDK
jgi:uncharacterized protein (TIGR00106 family)